MIYWQNYVEYFDTIKRAWLMVKIIDNKEKNKVGRKEVIDELKLQKLEQAFMMGCSDAEACLYAGISTATLYNYQQKNSEFLEQKQVIKTNPKLLARRNVFRALNEGDVEVSKWYLKHKVSDEFNSNSNEVRNIECNIYQNQISNDEITKIKEALNFITSDE